MKKALIILFALNWILLGANIYMYIQSYSKTHDTTPFVQTEKSPKELDRKTFKHAADQQGLKEQSLSHKNDGKTIAESEIKYQKIYTGTPKNGKIGAIFTYYELDNDDDALNLARRNLKTTVNSLKEEKFHVTAESYDTEHTIYSAVSNHYLVKYYVDGKKVLALTSYKQYNKQMTKLWNEVVYAK